MVTEIIHKLIGKIALILTAAFISITVQADETTIGSLTYETYTDGTAIVIDSALDTESSGLNLSSEDLFVIKSK